MNILGLGAGDFVPFFLAILELASFFLAWHTAADSKLWLLQDRPQFCIVQCGRAGSGLLLSDGHPLLRLHVLPPQCSLDKEGVINLSFRMSNLHFQKKVVCKLMQTKHVRS